MAKRPLLSRFIGVKMSPDMIAKIERIAQAEGNTQSAVIRRLLASEVEREIARTNTHAV